MRTDTARLARIACIFALLALVLLPGTVQSGAPPHRLDDNRKLLVHSTLLGNFGVRGRVLTHARLMNLFWDSAWDVHNPSSLSMASIDDVTRQLVSSRYFDAAREYGVDQPSFGGSFTSSRFCGSLSPGRRVSSVSIHAWVTCEVQTAPGVPLPDRNSLYLVFLPTGTTINNKPLPKVNACEDFFAYHAASVAVTGVPIVGSGAQTFPYLVVPAECALTEAGDVLDNLTAAISHEAIEAMTDPIPGLGWIDNSQVSTSRIQDALSSVTSMFKFGEASDICDQIIQAPRTRTENGVLVDPYWSNASNGCLPTSNLDVSMSPGTVPVAQASTVTVYATNSASHQPVQGDVMNNGTVIGQVGVPFTFTFDQFSQIYVHATGFPDSFLRYTLQLRTFTVAVSPHPLTHGSHTVTVSVRDSTTHALVAGAMISIQSAGSVTYEPNGQPFVYDFSAYPVYKLTSQGRSRDPKEGASCNNPTMRVFAPTYDSVIVDLGLPKPSGCVVPE